MLCQVASHAAEHGKVGVQELQTSASHAIDKASVKAEEVGAEITRQLLQASDNLAEETARSQAALEVSIEAGPVIYDSHSGLLPIL